MWDLGCPIFGLGVNIGHGAGIAGGGLVGRGGWRGGVDNSQQISFVVFSLG